MTPAHLAAARQRQTALLGAHQARHHRVDRLQVARVRRDADAHLPLRRAALRDRQDLHRNADVAAIRTTADIYFDIFPSCVNLALLLIRASPFAQEDSDRLESKTERRTGRFGH